MEVPTPARKDIDPALASSEDAVLADLTQAADHVHHLLTQAQIQSAALQEREAEITQLQTRMAALEAADIEREARFQDLQRQSVLERTQVEREKAKSEAQRVRAEKLEVVLRDLHRTFFTGNVYALILKAALTITGAARGVYVTVQENQASPKIRAAIDVDGYPQSSPSPFLQAACEQVIRTQKTLIANDTTALSHLPSPQAHTEHFQNCIITPVSLLRNLNGVIIAADKPDGLFDDGDVESVLAIGNQAGIAEENSRLREQLQQAYLATVSVMADAMEAKDSYTQGHSEMVSRYARLIGFHLNLSDLDRSIVRYAALLHDIGKIGVSDGILNKPGPLTPEERELVRAHVRLGHDLICHVPALRPVADAVLHHHECYDGTGYPTGLRGEDIPIAARIICVVDSYSAMITRRSYKDAYSEDWARAELRRCAGTQFDPRVVEAFLYVLDLPDLDKIDEDSQIDWLPIFHLASAEGMLQQPTENSRR